MIYYFYKIDKKLLLNHMILKLKALNSI